MKTSEIGKLAQDFTENFLKASGFLILARNFTVHRLGEIDLIASKGKKIYFFEVKGRSKIPKDLPPDRLVSSAQLRRIRKCASLYLDKYGSDFEICKIMMAFVHLAPKIFHRKIDFVSLEFL